MNVLVVAAHPDDAEIMCGGTMARHIEAGDDVHLLICAWAGDKRWSEQQSAAGVLGLTSVSHLDMPDTQVEVKSGGIDIMTDMIATLGIRRIYTHWPKDRHQDHRHTAAMARAAARAIPDLLYGEGPASLDFRPTLYVSLTPQQVLLRERALDKHVSQIKDPERGPRISRWANATHGYRAAIAHVNQCEAFAAQRMVV